MNIVILAQYFFPETGGPSNRILAMAKGMQKRGHRVTVICEKPNHPTGIIQEGYHKPRYIHKEWEGVPVIYTWVYARPDKTTKTRLLNYVSYMISSVMASRRVKGKVDVVLASSPPLFVGVSGWMVGKLKRAPYVFDVRDLWPDLAIAVGELKGRRAQTLAKKMESFIYRHAAGVTAVTRGFCDSIRSKSPGGKPVEMITNGTVSATFDVATPAADLRTKWNLPAEKFIIGYAGNLGILQGLPHVLEAAERMQSSHPDVHFVLVGDGPIRDQLVEEARAKGLANLEIRDKVTLAEAAEYMAASDALLVPLGNNPVYAMWHPSKLFDTMAAGRAMLLSVPGEARAIMEEARCGVFYEPESATGLVQAIQELRADPDFANMGERGRVHVKAHFDRDVLADRMTDFLERIAGDPKR